MSSTKKPEGVAQIVEAEIQRPANAWRWPNMPLRPQNEVIGTLNGASCSFKLTHGKGRGDTDRFYACFVLGSEVWYVDTGEGYLSAGADLTFGL